MKQFHSVIWKEDSWFIAKTLEVEVASQGKSEKEALNNLKEALELYFEDASKSDITKIEQPKLQDFSIHIHA
ncbi:MAG: type II toxin-antitoxin system HicB family antitoxin [Patescibacteria group bacterium]